MIELRPGYPQEAKLLTELCLRSKAVWGYDEAFMAACRAELTITAADFGSSALCVAAADGVIIGVVQLSMSGEDAHLHKLFIEPAAIGTGAGTQLFGWALANAKTNRARWLWIEADPEAAGFYRRKGAEDDGFVPSGSIPGRVLPRLRVDLSRRKPVT
jgi:GNAT superfamily N-acetyltransferase